MLYNIQALFVFLFVSLNVTDLKDWWHCIIFEVNSKLKKYDWFVIV